MLRYARARAAGAEGRLTAALVVGVEEVLVVLVGREALEDDEDNSEDGDAKP